jgi:Fe-S-cluster containining protein
MTKTSTLPVWYQEGLSFKCTGCGRCCTGSPGAVWITEQEIKDIADSFNLSIEDFERKYVRWLGNKKALIEKKPKNGNYDCVFLENNRCQIYNLRPKQCKTFPWWKENLSSKENWEEAAKSCEGINHPDAPLISLKEIQKDLH